ncbi:MAG: gamma carbonic anhydrase family protein [Steroidobacteraceae bacterium]
MIYRLGERRIETVGDDYFVAPSADVIGTVKLGRWASVWFGCVLRGDNDWIEIGDGSNVQDATVMHTDKGIRLRVGQNVTIGHKAFLHACTVGDNCLIANGAMLLDKVVVGSNTIVAAGAFVPPGKTIPSGVVVMGSPAKVVRELTDEDRARITRGAVGYQENAKRFRVQLQAE